MSFKSNHNDSSIVIISSKNDAVVCSVSGKASKIRNNNTSPVKHTIFLLFSEYATRKGEQYWSDLFMNAAKGSFCKGYKFTDGQNLSIKIGSSIHKFNVLFPDNSYIDSYYEGCKAFITQFTGITGNVDEDIVLVPLKEERKDLTTWSGTIPASNQVYLVNIFVNEMAIAYNLSDEKKDELRESLVAKIFIGDLTGVEISRDNYKISYIRGLTFDGFGNFFINSSPSCLISKNKKTVSTISTCEEKTDEKFVFKCSKGLSVVLKRHHFDDYSKQLYC